MSQATGGCLCGGLKYNLKTAPTQVVLCHCTHCQKASGAAFSVNALVPEGEIEFVGEMATYEDSGESGHALRRRFCSKCGASIGSQPDSIPGFFILKAGSLDDHASPGAAVAQVWTRSKQPWVSFGFETPSFEKNMTR
jgi:hypothetical protein